jgi:hypothetical protein
MSKTLRTAVLATLALTGTLAAGAARASDLHWSIGLNAPLHSGVSIGTVISNGPGYGGYGYYRPAPIYYSAPAPVYYGAPSYYGPAPVYVTPRHSYRQGQRYDNRRYRDRDRDGVADRWDRDRDGDGIPNRRDRRPDRPVYGPYGR